MARPGLCCAAALLWASAATARALPAQAAQDPPTTPLPAADAAPAPPAKSGNVTPETRGDVFMAKKMYRDAIDAYGQAPQESSVVQNKIGIAYHQLMEFGVAQKYYEKSIKMNPAYAEARNNLGAIYYARKNYRRAVKEYKRALKLAPNSASIYSNLGTAHFARHKFKEAFEVYQKALSLDPDVFEHRSTHGVLLQERSVEERAAFHYFLAKTYAKAGQNERALEYIRKSLEEGFKDRKKYLEEAEFAAIRELQEFKDLMAKEFRVL